MMILTHSITTLKNSNEHAILFEFAGKTFEALIVDTVDETYVAECLLLDKMQQPIEIDIPAFFGTGFSGEIYRLLYDRVHEKDDEEDEE